MRSARGGGGRGARASAKIASDERRPTRQKKRGAGIQGDARAKRARARAERPRTFRRLGDVAEVGGHLDGTRVARRGVARAKARGWRIR